MAWITPSVKPSRLLQAVCAYCLMVNAGSSANAKRPDASSVITRTVPRTATAARRQCALLMRHILAFAELVAAARRAVGDRARNPQLHFGAGSRFAPQMELGADGKGALAHPGQSPVLRAARAQMLRI